MWEFGPRRAIPEMLVAQAKARMLVAQAKARKDAEADPEPEQIAGETSAVAKRVAQQQQLSQRIDGHSTRRPVTVSAERLAEATALTPLD